MQLKIGYAIAVRFECAATLLQVDTGERLWKVGPSEIVKFESGSAKTRFSNGKPNPA